MMTDDIKITLIAEGVPDDALEQLLLKMRDDLNKAFPGSTRFVNGPPPLADAKQGVVATAMELAALISISGISASLQTGEYLHRAHKFLKAQRHPTQCVFKHGGREVIISGDFGPEQITAALNALHPEAQT
jgi:hypothetical protein